MNKRGQYSALLKLQSDKVAKLISKGYFITDGYQRNGYAHIILGAGTDIATVTIIDKLLSDTDLKDPLTGTTAYTVAVDYRTTENNSVATKVIVGTFYEPNSWYKYAPRITNKYSDLEQITKPEEN